MTPTTRLKVTADPVQDAPGAALPALVVSRATRDAARSLVAAWLAGKVFPLGRPDTSAAEELLVRLERAGIHVAALDDDLTAEDLDPAAPWNGGD